MLAELGFPAEALEWHVPGNLYSFPADRDAATAAAGWVLDDGDAGGSLVQITNRVAGGILAEVGLECVCPDHLQGGTQHE